MVPSGNRGSYDEEKLLMTRNAYTDNRNVKTLLEGLLASRGPVGGSTSYQTRTLTL